MSSVSARGDCECRNARARLTDLIMLMADLHAGQEVHSNRIKALLTASEWYRFRARMHGPPPPTFPTLETLNHLHEYRQRLKKADDMQRTALARMRSKTWIGPELFRQAEGAYESALEALNEVLDDHPVLAYYLSPFPDFSAVSFSAMSACKEGMPRLRSTIADRPAPVYSRQTSEVHVETAIELLRGIVRRAEARLIRQQQAMTGIQDGGLHQPPGRLQVSEIRMQSIG